jgi:hypothetical protein
MPELLIKFTEPTHRESELYWGAVWGGIADDNLWEGWIEFTSEADGSIIATPRETEQPNRRDLVYWAHGLTAAYLEGALQRALNPITSPERQQARRVVATPPRSAPSRRPSIPAPISAAGPGKRE